MYTEIIISSEKKMTKHIFSNGHALVIGVAAYSPYADNLDCTLDDAKGIAGYHQR